MPEHIKLLSPWFQNVLFDRRSSLRERFHLKPARDFANYLRTSVDEHSLQIDTGATVRRVLASGDGFEVLTDSGTANRVCLSTQPDIFPSPGSQTFRA